MTVRSATTVPEENLRRAFSPSHFAAAASETSRIYGRLRRFRNWFESGQLRPHIAKFFDPLGAITNATPYSANLICVRIKRTPVLAQRKMDGGEFRAPKFVQERPARFA